MTAGAARKIQSQDVGEILISNYRRLSPLLDEPLPHGRIRVPSLFKLLIPLNHRSIEVLGVEGVSLLRLGQVSSAPGLELLDELEDRGAVVGAPRFEVHLPVLLGIQVEFFYPGSVLYRCDPVDGNVAGLLGINHTVRIGVRLHSISLDTFIQPGGGPLNVGDHNLQ